MKKVIVLLSIFILYYLAFSQTVMVITGTVIDSVTTRPIEKVIISDESHLTTSYTDRDGRYKFITEATNSFRLFFNKEGYVPNERLLQPAATVTLDVRLSQVVQNILVSIDSINSGQYIYGHVDGLSPQEYNNYKIIIYVQTNKWYIHPLASNREGQGFAGIQNNGTWRLQTIYRGNDAFLIASLLVRKEYIPPSIIECYSDDPRFELLSKISPRANIIIERPDSVRI